MRLSLCTLFLFCMICCPFESVSGQSDRNNSVSIQNKFARLGAWATTGLTFATGLVGFEQVSESVIAYLASLLPFGASIVSSRVPRIIGGAMSLPLTGYLYIKYHQLVWYMTYIMYSGKQVSPIIAREIAQHLDSYVRCMEMIREIHKELEVLVNNAEGCVAGSGKEEAIKLIGQAISAVFERELSDAESYLMRIHRQLEEIQFDDACKAYSARGGSVEQHLDLVHLRGFEHPDFSKIDIETLDHLIKDILAYWHTYLASLAAAIDQRVVLCQKVHAIENFISGVLNRPLFPAFEQALAPTPTVKQLCAEYL